MWRGESAEGVRRGWGLRRAQALRWRGHAKALMPPPRWACTPGAPPGRPLRSPTLPPRQSWPAAGRPQAASRPPDG